MFCAGAWGHVVVLTLAAAASTASAPHHQMSPPWSAARPQPPSRIVASVTTVGFTLHVYDDCRVQLSTPLVGARPRVSDADAHRGGTAATSKGTRVPLVSLFNPVALARSVDFEPCAAASVESGRSYVVPNDQRAVRVASPPRTASASHLQQHPSAPPLPSTLAPERRLSGLTPTAGGGAPGQVGGNRRGDGEAPVTVWVTAAHGQGQVGITINTGPSYITLGVASTSKWNAPPSERHLAFGIFWEGLLDNRTTHPLVMGKLMGPYGIPAASFSAPAPVSAGFMPLGRAAYYNVLFAVAPSAKAQLAFTVSPTAEVPSVWARVGIDQHILQPAGNPHRFATWMWTPVSEHDKETMAARAIALGVQLLFIDQALDNYNWTFYEHKYPRGINFTTSWLRAQGLKVGLHTLPYPPTQHANDPSFAAAVLVPEGLAPTFRSGDMWTKTGTVVPGTVPTEDLGFWWGHEQEGASAANGNPHFDKRYGWECPQAPGALNCSRWGSNMTLVNTSWSKRGVYRSGGAIGFDGSTSFGVVPHIPSFNTATFQLTLGMTLHLPGRLGLSVLQESKTSSSVQPRWKTLPPRAQCLAERAGSWKLTLSSDMHFEWTVNTSRGLVTASSSTVSGPGPFALKATFNSSTARLFVGGVATDSATRSVDSHTVGNGSLIEVTLAVGSGPASIQPSESDILFGASIEGGYTNEHLDGALEEIYLKNVSTEDRPAYLYTDNARNAASAQGGLNGAYVFDFTRQTGREWYANAITTVLNAAEFDVTQFDGFEVNFLIAGWDWAHSPATFSAGMYRLAPAPDWYALGFPTRWGLGVLQAMDRMKMLLNPNTAVECSFLAPGLGPFRPDLAPYVDQNLDESGGVMRLGLEWHPKMLLRTASSGTVINPYVTIWWPTATMGEIDYWFGGLVTGGIAPQLGWSWSENTTLVSGVAKWLKLYAHYGHLNESGVHPLFYDHRCCHIEGICEWVACEDIVLSRLTGGEIGDGRPVAGLYGGSSRSVAISPGLVPNGTILLVFQAANVSQLHVELGQPKDDVLTLVMMSHVTITLGGGWWLLSEGQGVEQTIFAANGSVMQPARVVVPPTRHAHQVTYTVAAAMGQSAVLRKQEMGRK